MKTIRKSFLLLAFAAGAMFVIGNNVFADPNVLIIAQLDEWAQVSSMNSRMPDGLLVVEAFRYDTPGFHTWMLYGCGTSFTPTLEEEWQNHLPVHSKISNIPFK